MRSHPYLLQISMLWFWQMKDLTIVWARNDRGMRAYLLHGPFCIKSVIPLSFTKPRSGQEPCPIPSTVSNGNPQKGQRKDVTGPLMICVHTWSLPHCRRVGTTLHPKLMNKGPKESLWWHAMVKFQQGNKKREKKAGYISSLKEKSISHPAYCTPGSSQFFSYSCIRQLSPALIFFLLSKSQTEFAFIPKYPKDRPWFPSSWKTHWRAYSTKAVHTVLDAHGKQFSPVQSSGLPIASPSYGSKIRHSLSYINVYQMNIISWIETQMNWTQGTIVFIMRKLSHLQCQNQDCPQ